MSSAIAGIIAGLRQQPPDVTGLTPEDFHEYLGSTGWKLVVSDERRSIWEHPQRFVDLTFDTQRVFIPGYKSVDWEPLARLALLRIARLPDATLWEKQASHENT